jgi:lysophospholipid acyltransferase (LPLAT)-like uncharacterized protein
MGAIVAEIFQGRNFGTIFGTVMLSALAGGAAGPWLTGALHDWFGNYVLAFWLGEAISGVSALAIWRAAPYRLLPPRATRASMKKLLRHPTTQAILARLLGWYMSLALRTIRWTLDGVENVAPHAAGAPAVIAFWHENLPMMAALAMLASKLPGYRYKPIHALVSHHRDGRFIGDVVRRFGIAAVYGSSSRGGAASLRIMLKLLANGEHIGITPDGPRGPRRVADPGVAQLAALAGVPVLPCAARTSRHKVLGTWDRMAVPLPFGRGVMVCGPSITVPREGWRDAVPEIAAALNHAAGRADLLCQR